MAKIISNKNFKYGIIDSVEDNSIPREASSGSLNWLTKGSEIELRRGSYRLGITDNMVGKVTGGIVATRADGVEKPKTFFTGPVGKTIDWRFVQWDWREKHEYDKKTPVIGWQYWEADWAALPLKAMYEIGGLS